MEKLLISTGKHNGFRCIKYVFGDGRIVYENIQTIIDLDQVLDKYKEDKILPEDTEAVIDLLLTKASVTGKKEKHKFLEIAQFFINKYEEYIGRKIYKHVI